MKSKHSKTHRSENRTYKINTIYYRYTNNTMQWKRINSTPKTLQNTLFRAISQNIPSPKLHKILILFILLIKKLRPSLLLYNNKYSKASRAFFTEMLVRE